MTRHCYLPMFSKTQSLQDAVKYALEDIPVYLIGKVGKIVFHKIKTAVNPLKLQNSVFDPTATGEQPA